MKFSNSKFSPIANPSSLELTEKILFTGIHLEITEALREITLQKTARLLRRQTSIVRIRISLEHVKSDRAQFVAKGHIEISGPDLLASVASDDGYKSIDLLIDRLDRMLRERTRTVADRRNNRPEGTEFRDHLAASYAPASTRLRVFSDTEKVTKAEVISSCPQVLPELPPSRRKLEQLGDTGTADPFTTGDIGPL